MKPMIGQSTVAVYTFTVSQPLTEEQMEYLNAALQKLPCVDKVHYTDLPDWVMDVELAATGSR